jgi:hypothetical protein
MAMSKGLRKNDWNPVRQADNQTSDSIMSFRAEYSSEMTKMLHEDSEEEWRNLILEQHEPCWDRHIIVIWKFFKAI